MILYMLVNFSLDYALNRRVSDQLGRLIDRNEQITDLITVQRRLKQQFDLCIGEPLPENILIFNDLNDNVDSLLKDLKRSSSNREDALVHLRVIRNMLDYEMDSTTMLFSRREKTEEDYREINFLRILLESMNKEIQSLMVLETRRNSIQIRESFNRAQGRERAGSVALIVLIVFLSAAVLYSMKIILARMGILISSAHSFYQGELRDAEIPMSEFSELNELSQAFNKMNQDIHNYISQVEEKSRLERELQNQHLENERKDKMLQQARLDFLQSQINPHFLFNALNAVGKHSVLNNPEISLELIESISRILRYSLDHHSELVRVSEEFRTIESYLRIQKVRYEDRLEYELLPDRKVMGLMMPAMMIQPLVENSIKYGLDTRREALALKISLSPEAGALLIRVEDNGPGISEENLDRIGRSEGIGLSNVRDRLNLSYGKGDHLSIDTEPGTGTVISIRIPIEETSDV